MLGNNGNVSDRLGTSNMQELCKITQLVLVTFYEMRSYSISCCSVLSGEGYQISMELTLASQEIHLISPLPHYK